MRFYRFRKVWTRFWVKRSHARPGGRIAAFLATWLVPPFYGQIALANLDERGFTAPGATIHHAGLVLGQHCFIGERVLIYQDDDGGPVTLGNGVHLHRESVIQTGVGGSVIIGDDTHVQPRCQISAYKGCLRIGKRVEIAPGCAFYPYNHAVDSRRSIREQPIYTAGGISVGDDVWLGYGVIVLDGVEIGNGAVIGAGSVVTGKIPDNAIAVGIPARVIRYRGDADHGVGDVADKR
ncbi:MAG: transferase hexapeptide repeat containing protein [Gammaproteobacteria bacterium]|nr:MAG: transferase hexapeptide repeat containing protein [Gammaproteobacteria bacterium]TND04518.1 MAG: transferase hexapeptide repeat containing protein [Gammaproteobacteria bacterium]